jgi:hypothetical protein
VLGALDGQLVELLASVALHLQDDLSGGLSLSRRKRIAD